MGGDIKVESNPCCGSTFSFRVRLKTADPAELNTATQNDSPPQSTNNSFKILLVEDNPVNRELAGILLQNEGHRVQTANNGLEALQLLAHQNVDRILMDVQMPEMNGFTAAKIIRSLEQDNPLPKDIPAELKEKLLTRLKGGNIPIVALTAHAMSGDRERYLQSGMNDYISKPFEPEQIAGILQKTIA